MSGNSGTSPFCHARGDSGLFFNGQEHYRGCANLPFLVNWPGRVKSGQVVDGPDEEIDLFPTIAEFAGLPRTPDVYTLRTPEWRLTYVPSLRTGELFDLREDPDEFVNRWSDPKFGNIRSKLRDQLLDRVLSNRDPLPIRENRYWEFLAAREPQHVAGVNDGFVQVLGLEVDRFFL